VSDNWFQLVEGIVLRGLSFLISESQEVVVHGHEIFHVIISEDRHFDISKTRSIVVNGIGFLSSFFSVNTLESDTSSDS
jgi:hypothetical protein